MKTMCDSDGNAWVPLERYVEAAELSHAWRSRCERLQDELARLRRELDRLELVS